MKFKQSVVGLSAVYYTTFNGNRLFPVDEKEIAIINKCVTKLFKTPTRVF